MGEARRIRENYKRLPPTAKVFGYSFAPDDASNRVAGEGGLNTMLRRARAVAKSLRELRHQGLNPDVVYGHPGWGEMLYVRDVFPNARIVNYCEFYFNRYGQDYGFDPEFTRVVDDNSGAFSENMIHSASLLTSDCGISPTHWQASRYPLEIRQKITVVHDGIDTTLVRPAAKDCVAIQLGDKTLSLGDEVITYVARNLEPYRGFHIFMRSLPRVLRERPTARVVIVGSDGVSYGRPLQGMTYRQYLLREVGAQLDLSRVHFLGHLPHHQYLQVLQMSTVHVYLTYPFVLSWSMLDAMASGCLIIGSRTVPVEEVLRHEENGLLVDFFDVDGLADQIIFACSRRRELSALRSTARDTVLKSYDLRDVCLPRQIEILRGDQGRDRGMTMWTRCISV
nr:glycosyltransferase [Pandoraea sp. LA3]